MHFVFGALPVAPTTELHMYIATESAVVEAECARARRRGRQRRVLLLEDGGDCKKVEG